MSINSCGPGKKVFYADRVPLKIVNQCTCLFSVTFYFDCESGLKRQNSLGIRCLFFFLLFFFFFFFFFFCCCCCWLLVFFGWLLRWVFISWNGPWNYMAQHLLYPTTQIVAEHNGFTLVVRVSVRPSTYFRFQTITWAISMDFHHTWCRH